MLFQLESLRKTYGRITALDGLTVAVPEGAIGLLGPNGAGKTTLIRSLLGLIKIDAGRGEVLGLDLRTRRREIRQRVGFMPEDDCLFPALVGVEFVAYAGKLCGMQPGDAMQRAHEVLNYVGMGEERYRPVEGYSTGMKQKLKLAAALVHDPDLLILDEPTNGLDPRSRVEMLELARDLARLKGMSLIFSSHLLDDVEAVCDHILVLGRGRLLLNGPIDQLKAIQESICEVRVRDRQAEFGEALTRRGLRVEPDGDVLRVAVPEAAGSTRVIWETAREAGAQVRLVRPVETHLEDVFLRAVRDGELTGSASEPGPAGGSPTQTSDEATTHAHL